MANKQSFNKVKPVAACNRHFKYNILSFLLPLTIFGAVFALHRVFPFGPRQILVYDLWTQYFPFLSGLWHKLRDGTLSVWSWSAGAGHDYIGFAAYYLTSPLNLLSLLLPHEWLRESLTVVLLLKLGCTGLFTSMLLYYISINIDNSTKNTGLAIAVFSSLYALCAFTLGYYWIIIWFDTVAMLPLVITGFLSLLRENKYKLFICSLALALLFNFYIAFFICLLIILSFFCYSIVQKYNKKMFFYKLTMITGCSILAVGISAVMLIPVTSALRNIFSISEVYDKLFFFSFFDILGNFIAFTPPSVLHSVELPNLYCGMIVILLSGGFYVSPKVSFREKIVLSGILIFFLLCCNISGFNYAIHGFRYPNGIPSRFSFLISFILVITAYRSYLILIKAGSISKRYFAAMLISAAVILVAAIFGRQTWKSIIASMVLCVSYLFVFFIFKYKKAGNVKRVLNVIFLFLVITELSVTSWIGVKTVGTTDRNEFNYLDSEIKNLLHQYRPSDNDFYRMETTLFLTYNDSSLYNYSGISFFSTTIDDSIRRFIQGLGFMGGGAASNSVIYDFASPLSNAFMAIRYVPIHYDILTYGVPPEMGPNWKISGVERNALLLENIFYLPLGFMVNEEISDYKTNNKNSLLLQNDLFSRATGIKGSLFLATDFTGNDDTSKVDIIMPLDGILYAHLEYYNFFELENDLIDVFVNGRYFCGIDVLRNEPYTAMVGEFYQDDIITLTSKRGTVINVGYFNNELFKQGYALLADEPLILTRFSGTRVSGTVTAHKDGLLYTSIPGKNWNVYVDGVKSELLLIDNAMAAVRLSKGIHNVEFRYFNKNFVAGIIISLASLAVFAALIVYERRKRRK